MIPCKLIYKMPNGAASDSLQNEVELYYIPDVGGTIHINTFEGTINQVENFIDTEKNKHIINIYYS